MGFRWTAPAASRHERGVFALFALLVALFAGHPVVAATVQRIDVSAGRIAIRFDAAVSGARAVMIDGPRRIAVDVPGVRPNAVQVSAGVVSALRQGRRPDGTRLVFDLASPAVIADGGFEDDGRELVLTLREADAPAFTAASLAAPLDFLPFNFSATKPRYKLSIPVPPPARGVRLPRIAGEDGRPLVVIDAGHGGVDPGAISPESGLREKDVTLRIAQAIRDELVASGRVRVALTRDDDRYLILRERYGIARRLKADLFISVHCDSVGSGEATGASVYTLSEIASDKEAARLAARENKADVINGVDLDRNADVSSILIDLTQRETMNASAGFARLLEREGKPLLPMKANFHRMASLMVLKAPDTPSILLETGYISNPADAAFLDSTEGRERIAESVRRAVEVYFARRTASR